MDYIERFRNSLPRNIKEAFSVDFELLLTLLREAIRRNDVKTATEIVNGVELTFNVKKFKNKDGKIVTTLTRICGGLVGMHYGPNSEDLKSRVRHAVLSAYDNGFIPTLKTDEWMFDGSDRRLPKELKGHERNTVIKALFKDFLLEDTKNRHLKFVRYSYGLNLHLIVDTDTPIELTKLKELSDKAKSLAFARNGYISSTAEAEKLKPFYFNNLWYQFRFFTIPVINYIERCNDVIIGFNLLSENITYLSLEELRSLAGIYFPYFSIPYTKKRK
jgi:hypothetical protein